MVIYHFYQVPRRAGVQPWSGAVFGPALARPDLRGQAGQEDTLVVGLN